MNKSGQGGITDTLTPQTPMYQPDELPAGLQRLANIVVTAWQWCYKDSVTLLQRRDNTLTDRCPATLPQLNIICQPLTSCVSKI